MRLKYTIAIIALLLLIFAVGSGCKKKVTEPTVPQQPTVPEKPAPTQPPAEEEKPPVEVTQPEQATVGETGTWTQRALVKPDAKDLVKNVVCGGNVQGTTDKERVGELKFDIYNKAQKELCFAKKGSYYPPSKLLAVNFNGVALPNLECGADCIKPGEVLTCKTPTYIHFKNDGNNIIQLNLGNEYVYMEMHVCEKGGEEVGTFS